MTLLSDEPFFRWLPDDEDEIARHFGKEGHSVHPWVADTPNTERQLDRHDPYGATSALDRPFPMDFTRDALGVASGDAVTREWNGATGKQFYAEAWGAEGGRGEYAWSETGSRLFVGTAALKSLLAALDRHLVILVKLQKYHRGKSSGRAGDTSSFTHRSLIVVSNKRGDVWLPQRLSNKAKRAIEAIETDRRRDFNPRFRAIAGLPDEWLARRNDLRNIDGGAFRIFIEGLTPDEAKL